MSQIISDCFVTEASVILSIHVVILNCVVTAFASLHYQRISMFHLFDNRCYHGNKSTMHGYFYFPADSEDKHFWEFI